MTDQAPPTPLPVAQLIEGLSIQPVSGPTDAVIRDIQEDSRRVGPGCLFVARKGQQSDGLAHARDAFQAGAAAVLTDRPYDPPRDIGPVAVLRCERLNQSAGIIAQRLLGQPAHRLGVIGITGTNGKTTTAYIVRHLLDTLGIRCGMIGTVEIDDGDTCGPAGLTTPALTDVHHLLARMVVNGCATCVMEVSSHALIQDRVAGIDFGTAVFTNLTGDHLDYHGTMEQYAAAKARLFDQLDARQGRAIVNADDPWHQAMIDGRTFAEPVLKFGVGNAPDKQSADYRATIQDMDHDGTRMHMRTMTGEIGVQSPLIGQHNVSNLLAAVAIVEQQADLKITDPRWQEAIAQITGVPGRLERVTIDGGDVPFTVLVDYAHTDDALHNVLTALRPLTSGRLRVLFGCGGDRDATKRPRMAEVACERADHVVITSDNPRTEDPQRIIDDILTGVLDANRSRVQVVADRAEAIARIVRDANDGDVVLLAGKGHEDYQIIGAERRNFDDREHAEAALRTVYGLTPGHAS